MAAMAGDEPVSAPREARCPACGATGETRVVAARPPRFRELLVSAFECGACGLKERTVDFHGEKAAHGVRFALTCETDLDLDRQLVKSDTAIASIPHLDLVIPSVTRRGVVTTVGGALRQSIADLAVHQRAVAGKPEEAREARELMDGLVACADGARYPFVFTLRDPAGNSHIQPFPGDDRRLEAYRYERSKEDDEVLEEILGGPAAEEPEEEEPEVPENEDAPSALRVQCPLCGAPGDEVACPMNIPHFKRIILVSLHCDRCGHKSAEVKNDGQAIPERGRACTVTCVEEADLRRDVVKSDTATLRFPGLGLELAPGELGAVWATVEGCLAKALAALRRRKPFTFDEDAGERAAFEAELGKVRAMRYREAFPFTLEVRDPLANSFVGPRREAAGAASWRTAQADARERWSQHVFATEGWLYAVQTLRNGITTNTFLASTVLTLSGLSIGTLGGAASAAAPVASLQLGALAACLVGSAYTFSQSARLMLHAGFMFPVAGDESAKTAVCKIMVRSHKLQWAGWRWLYLGLWPVAWIFGGPYASLAVALGLARFFDREDRTPVEDTNSGG